MKKNEIVRQHDLKDCGVASLLSIIIHYGGYVPIETLRIDCNTTLEGTTAYDIIKTAKKYGFDSYGIKLEANGITQYVPVTNLIEVENGYSFAVVLKNIKDYDANITATAYVEYDGVKIYMQSKTYSILSMTEYYINNGTTLGLTDKQKELVQLFYNYIKEN